MCSHYVFTNTPLVLLSERDPCFDVAKIWLFMESSKNHIVFSSNCPIFLSKHRRLYILSMKYYCFIQRQGTAYIRFWPIQ